MSIHLLGVFIVTAIGTLLLTAAVRSYAQKALLIDCPNERSSHTVPTPRGGGVAIALVSLVCFIVLGGIGVAEKDLTIALVIGGAAIACVGLVDDRMSVSAGIRISVHLAAALLAVLVIGGLPELQVGTLLIHPGWLGSVLAVLGITWVINLFNFMDGIDGIAASEAMFVAGAGGVIAWVDAGVFGYSAAALTLAGASFGFLLWNWPPAKIFMGDAGSGYLGFAISVFALASAREAPVGPVVWLILGATFVADATVTLVRRFLRRERVFEAHRIHAYQWLSRRWGHRRVTITFLIVNIGCLLPLAVYANRHPERAAWVAGGVIGVSMFMAALLGAGRPETADSCDLSRG